MDLRLVLVSLDSLDNYFACTYLVPTRGECDVEGDGALAATRRLFDEDVVGQKRMEWQESVEDKTASTLNEDLGVNIKATTCCMRWLES